MGYLLYRFFPMLGGVEFRKRKPPLMHGVAESRWAPCSLPLGPRLNSPFHLRWSAGVHHAAVAFLPHYAS
ncbi:MAG: hypothetical protein DMG56_27800 [Acidobacteria bacterium]|nr:MAG: hypothetical protein DMG56_27800 [Acidobacteriota bacterium]